LAGPINALIFGNDPIIIAVHPETPTSSHSHQLIHFYIIIIIITIITEFLVRMLQ